MSEDINKDLSNIQQVSKKVEAQVIDLFRNYEELFKRMDRSFREEKQASTSLSGLEDFYRLVQTVRRNKDIVGSLVRGIRGLRSLSEFRVVEEEITDKGSK